MKHSPQKGEQLTGTLLFFVLGLGLAGFAIYNRDWLLDVVMNGATPVTAAELTQAKGVETLPHRYVSLPVSSYKETGMNLSMGRGGSVTRKADYVLVQVDDHWLVAAVLPGQRPKQLVGYLSNWKSGTYYADALPNIAAKLPAKYTQHLLSFQLDAVQAHDEHAKICLFGSVGLSVVSFALAAWYFRRFTAKQPDETSPPLAAAPAGQQPAPQWRWD